MKIKTPDHKSLVIKNLPVWTKRPIFLFLALFIGYHLLLLGIVFSLFYANISPVSRQRIINKSLALIENTVPSPPKALEETTSPTEQIALEIASENLQKLARLWASNSEKTYGPHSEKNPVSATLRHKNANYEVAIHPDSPGNKFWEYEDKWPLLVNLKHSNTFLGMKSFYLNPAQVQESVNDWLISNLLAKEGIKSKHYDYCMLEINDAGQHPYIIEEVFPPESEDEVEGRKQFLNFYRNSHWTEKNPLKAGQAATTKQIDLSSTEHSSELFNLPQLASYLALTELFGGIRSVNLVNTYFVPNPQTGLLEPFANEDLQIQLLEKNGLLGVEMPMDGALGAHTNIKKKPTSEWHELVFGDPYFYALYIKALEDISEPTFLDAFFDQQQERLNDILKILKSKDNSKSLPGRDILYQNQNYIKQALRPAKLVQAHFRKIKSIERQLELEVANIHNLPVEVLFGRLSDSTVLPLSEPIGIIQANERLSPVGITSISLDLPDHLVWADTLIRGMQVVARVLGGTTHITEEVIPYAMVEPTFLSQDLIRQKSNVRDFDFLLIDERQKQIHFRSGTHQLDKNLVLPRAYQVFAHEGTQIDMTNNANILSFSPLFFLGSEQAPIAFYSSDSSAQGITVLNGQETSHLTYVHFENLSNPRQNGWVLTSGITFYESPVQIENCFFGNNLRGDDYLNIVRCHYTIDNSTFFNTYADAFDGDFCQGTIRNTNFLNSGNDAIDISGSQLVVENILIDQTADKGISAGENSRIEGSHISIKNAEIAVTSKDLSLVDIGHITIQDSRIAYTAFQKKPEFGPAFININNSSKISGQTEILYLIENGSSMTISGKAIKSSVGIDHVKQILYGVKYGKSSS